VAPAVRASVLGKADPTGRTVRLENCTHFFRASSHLYIQPALDEPLDDPLDERDELVDEVCFDMMRLSKRLSEKGSDPFSDSL
jgi:hypothetical protein